MPVDYQSLNDQLAALLAGEKDALANSANFVGLLYAGIPNVNWLGIYVLRGKELVLGPFQGLPACVRIPVGQGVCGTAAEKRETLRVGDVHEFAGHIVCDPESRSEVVVPLLIHGELIGVLDIDSPQPSRFSEVDQSGVELLCDTFLQSLLLCPGEFI
ncbi:MAG: GAF domain-containing protein [Proteobacteria bacterium]|nr:GAF domain-containing protein [Pseudomonadota bacterium]